MYIIQSRKSGLTDPLMSKLEQTPLMSKLKRKSRTILLVIEEFGLRNHWFLGGKHTPQTIQLGYLIQHLTWLGVHFAIHLIKHLIAKS